MICNIQDPLTKEDYTRDPRNVARKAVNYMKSTGIADTAYFGPELEFFVFDDVRYDQTPALRLLLPRQRRGRLEHRPRREAEPRLQAPLQGGLLPGAAVRRLHDIRTRDDADHDRVRPDDRGAAPRGRHRRAGRDRHALRAAGRDGRQRAEVQVHRQERRPQARQDGDVHAQAALQDNGSGMHVHSRCGRTARTCSPARGYAGLSDMALYAIGGLLKHAPALCAITNPTTNSYKRLVPGYEAPVNLAYSRRNRSAAIRIPVYSPSPKAKRIEFRCPDGSAIRTSPSRRC